MGLLFALLLQAADPGLDDLPVTLDLGGQGGQEQRRTREEALGFEVFVLSTSFDDGLKIEDEVGFGGDLKLGWTFNEKTNISVNLGYAGWNTENDDDKVVHADVMIRQYRLGFSVEVPFKVASLGFGFTGGLLRFHSDFEDDTSPYIEFEGSFGVRPVRELRIALVGMATHTQSSFNREHTHLFHNYSGGLAVEVTF